MDWTLERIRHFVAVAETGSMTQAAKELGIERPTWVLPAPYAHWLERYR